MLRVTLTIDAKSRDQMHWVLDYWRQLPDIVADEIWEIGLGAFTERVGRIFDMEGDPSWAPLSDSTIHERALVGYGPDPILQRGGILKQSLTVPELGQRTYVDRHVWLGTMTFYSETHRTGNVSETSGAGGGDHAYRFGTLDDRFIWLSEGDEDMPGRDMVPMGGQRREVGAEIERRVVAKMKGWANPDG